MPATDLVWVELSVSAHAEAVEAVSEILDRVGYNGIAVEQPLEGPEHIVKAYLVDDPGVEAAVSRVTDALGHLQAFGLGPIGEVQVRRIEDEDWLESWKRSFVPIRIGSFLVRPTWASDSADGDAIPLVLDPGMAFGTGLHPTTQQCLEALSTMELEGRSFLDVGTGSGILAIAASKRGAQPIIGVDTDPLAVSAAKEHAEFNGAPIEVSQGSASDVLGTFDVVVANIVAPVLIAIAVDLRARLSERGVLVLAGVIATSEAGVREAFMPLAVVDHDQRGDWVRLILQ